MFNKLKKNIKENHTKKIIEKNSLEGKLMAELKTQYELNPPTPEKQKQIKDMHEQFERELSAIEDELFKQMRELEIMYMRSEIKLLKDSIIKNTF